MRKGRKSEDGNFLIHIQSLSCESQTGFINTPTKIQQSSATRSPVQKKVVKNTRLVIPATKDTPVSFHCSDTREKVETADANISTSCDFLFTVSQTPIPVYNVNKELTLKPRSPISISPDARNSFWTPIRRSRLVRRSPRRRETKAISMDLKTPPHLLSTMRNGYGDSVSRFTLYRPQQSSVKSNFKSANWLEPLCGKLTGYSLLKRQRLRRKDLKGSAGKNQESSGDLLYGASMASASSLYTSDLFYSGKSLFLT